jgi:general secretion pathway protein D
MAFNDFLHYVFGDLLQVSYLIEASVKNKKTPVTLELKDKVSTQRLFQLVQRVLTQNGTSVVLNDNIFYLYPTPKRGAKSDIAFGFGRTEQSVPKVSGSITQYIPLKYNVSKGLKNTVSSLVDATVYIDPALNLMSVIGNREQIIRAISLLDMIDSPLLYNKSTALLSFAYIDTFTFIEKVTELLAQDGISTNSLTNNTAANVNFIPLEHLGKVVVFATADEVLERIEYWGKLIDKPATGSEQSYYIYHPKYARAADLGQSLASLLGSTTNNYGSQRSSNNRQNSVNNNISNNSLNNNRRGSSASNAAGNNAQSSQTIEGDKLRMVVDERANALIFYSTGKHYQELQPIIRQLDIMPKQVMLEVVIAEVKLTGSFAKGVEFAITSGASSDKQSAFSFDSEGGFNYSIVGLPGNFNVNLNQTDGLINVLSKPTLVVRDGVTASISVGDDIPTIGSTTTDPINGERQTTNIVYRKTGIDLNVTPTVNAQGTVIMSISQNISNVSASGPSIGGSNAVFERTLQTEVVAGDGQTVMLGGLISENKSTGASSIPMLGTLPLLGHLFRSDTEDTDKTELVVLVTPRIISNASDWEMLKNDFANGLKNIKF